VSHVVTVIGAAVVFAGTDVDDLAILVVLFLAARSTGRPRPGQIVAGQYLGVAALLAVSAVAALGLLVIPDEWVGLLGLIPIGLGCYELFARDDHDDAPGRARGTVSVAFVTVANGADNLAVYTPLLRTYGLGDSLILIAVFAVMVGVWCALAAALGGHPRVVSLMERYGERVVPVVFIAVGVLIIATSGVVPRLLRL
jgi:cadmium resistance protein CadD (predicted permease)